MREIINFFSDLLKNEMEYYSLSKYFLFFQILNVVAIHLLSIFLQRFFGYNLVLNIRNFPWFLQFERIDFSLEGDDVVIDLNRWISVPFAWFTEIILLLSDRSKFQLDYFVYFPDKRLVVLFFLIQLIYIYSCHPEVLLPR